ncbi:MAG TPA: hypothetical protein VIV62_00885 [Chthoniobacterales bacterium]
MRLARLGFTSGKIDIINLFRIACVLVTILMVIVFFAGCATSQTSQADSNSTMQKADSSREVHGEVGVMYGASAR